MKKILAVFLTLLLLGQAEAQRRYAKVLPFFYPTRGAVGLSASTVDTVRTTVADTVSLGLYDGGLSPVAVSVLVKARIADLADSDGDTLRAQYQVGNDLLSATMVSTAHVAELAGVSTANSTFARTFVFNTTGAAAAHNTQASVTPLGNKLRLILKNGSTLTVDSLEYKVRALAVYKAPGYGRVFQAELPFTYRNGNPRTHSVGDTLFGATADTVNIPLMFEGLYPRSVSVHVKTADADVSGTPDSVSAIYYSAIDNLRAPIVSTTATLENGALGTFVRNFVFNTTGASMAHAAQGTIAPNGTHLRMVLFNSSVSPAASADTTSYKIRVIGEYEK